MIEVKKRHQALLMVDEAHSIGVLGATGGGIGEHFGVDRSDVELWSGTLSKSLASCGGYVAGSDAADPVPEVHDARLHLQRRDHARRTPRRRWPRCARCRPSPRRSRRCAATPSSSCSSATEAGIDTGDSRGTPIIPCIVGDSLKALRLSNALLRRGINVNPILYPAVPEELARLRFFITSCHSEEQIRSAVKILAEELPLLDDQRGKRDALPRPAHSTCLPRLFCFHHAGGGSSLYQHWHRALSPHASVWPVLLPGRERRMREPRFTVARRARHRPRPPTRPLPHASRTSSSGTAWAR